MGVSLISIFLLGTKYGIRAVSLAINKESSNVQNDVQTTIAELETSKLHWRTIKAVVEKLAWVAEKTTFTLLTEHLASISALESPEKRFISWFLAEASNFPQSALWILEKHLGPELIQKVTLNAAPEIISEVQNITQELRLSTIEAEKFSHNLLRVLPLKADTKNLAANWVQQFGDTFMQFMKKRNSL